MAYGKSIELFLVNGNAEGIITAELSNWNGKAIKIPRADVNDCKREDIAGIGVYFLFCKDKEDGTDSVYIGEAENVLERLKQHIRDYSSEKELYFWSTAVVFTGRDLNKALIRYLENKLVSAARDCKQYDVLTKNTYANTVMKESQVAVMDEFFDNIKVLISTLGYRVFVEAPKAKKSEKYLYCKGNNAEAKGFLSSEGLTVTKGSIVSDHEANSFRTGAKSYYELRKKLEANGVIENRRFTIDYEFSSPSAAAAVVLGRSANGKKEWNIL